MIVAGHAILPTQQHSRRLSTLGLPCANAGAGIPVQQLPGSRLVCSLVASLQVTTFAVFIYGMTPLIPDRMPETCVLVACLLGLPLLHYRLAASLPLTSAFHSRCLEYAACGLVLWACQASK